MDFKQFLEILWSQKPSGDTGFEGLIRKLLEKITGQRFFLSQSGRQEGRDISNELGIGNFVTVECKRYDERTPLTSDDLLVKLNRAAISEPKPDIWVVVTTKRLGEQHHRDLKKASDLFGISYFCIDAEWEGRSLLIALCSSAPEIVVAHLSANVPKIDAPIPDEIKNYLSGLATDEEVIFSVNYIRSSISKDIIGYADWKCKQNEWLLNQFISPQSSNANLGQNLAVRSSKCKLVERDESRRVLNNWWEGWLAKPQKMVVLGEEGDGKSWLVSDWLADRLTQEEFPPVIFIPSTHFKATDLIKLIVQTIHQQIGKHQESYWEKRINIWIDSLQKSPVFLLVLDGLNERPGFNWRQFLSLLETSPYTDKIAVLITCRSIFWSEQIGFDELSYESFTLLPYDEKELAKALEIEGLQSDNFDDKLLPLLSKPRYFNLTIKLKDRLAEQGDVTIERLIYEDWRDQISRKKGRNELLSNDEFQELITGLSRKWSDQGTLNRKDIHDELSMYGDGKTLLDEMKNGCIFRRKNSKWEIDSHYLILGLGLLLADEVEETFPEGETTIDELISKRLEPQPDMDLKVSICGMAFLHSLICREDYPDNGRLALFRAWIRGRNIQTPEWQRIPAYLPLCPKIYFKMAEFIWSTTGENQEAQDAFMCGFLKYGEQENVLSEAVLAFERWMGFMHPDGHFGRHAEKEEERKKGREEVREILGQSIEQRAFEFYGYPLEFIKEEGWLRLSAVALSVISHQERKPYTRALTSYALASTIMGYFEYQSAFNWVIRTSPDDVEKWLLSASKQLLGIKKFATQRAAFWLLTGLCSEKAIKLRNQIPAKYAFKNIMYEDYEKDPCKGFSLWDRTTYQNCIKKYHHNQTRMAELLKEVALDPELTFPDRFISSLRNVGNNLDFRNVHSSLCQTPNDLVLMDIEPALCAWCPESYAEIWCSLTSLLTERSGLSRRLLAFKIYDHLLLMRDEEIDSIEHVWNTVLQSDDQEDKNAEAILFPCVLWGKELKDQLDLIETRGSRGNYFRGHKPFIKKLKSEDVPIIKSYLSKFSEANSNLAANLLSYIAEAPPVLDPEFKALVFSIFKKGDTRIRGTCLELFFNAIEADAIDILIEEDWCIDSVESDYEKHWGSMFLCKYGTGIPFEDIVGRILPETLGYAIQCRGKKVEEILAFGTFIHETWKSIFSNKPLKFHASERTKVEIAWVDKNGKYNRNWKIHNDNNEALTFRSWDSIWGGGIKKANKKDIKDTFNLTKLRRKDNKANNRLADLLKSEKKSGNYWFLCSLKHLMIEDILDVQPNFLDEWIRVVLETPSDSHWLISRCRSFYESLCMTLLNRLPELGVKLFKHLRAIPDFQLSDGTTEIDSLLFCLFSAKDSDPVLCLRNEQIESCTSDKELFEIAFLAQFSSNQDWLYKKIDLWLSSKQTYDQVRALVLLGLMDGIHSTERLQEWIDLHTESWTFNCAEHALLLNQRNLWAKKWFEIFLTHNDNLYAWAAFRLFRRCIDRRFWLWGPEKVAIAKKTNRVDYFNCNKLDLQKNAIKNEKDKLKLNNRMIFSDTLNNQTWPWMEKYF
ncbi:NACHT domain-containing protein [uncultured Desulfobacter sp.]|uniref:NACHT domain-containing protein n=1 Tax=uncultured Desulfobacter sp. TaxID=240139 RepID=UPI0029F5A831|nr:NACHT domain-containing protein [uncultured Desulfobacter sp.]